jgi:hypothetical protein
MLILKYTISIDHYQRYYIIVQSYIIFLSICKISLYYQRSTILFQLILLAILLQITWTIWFHLTVLYVRNKIYLSILRYTLYLCIKPKFITNIYITVLFNHILYLLSIIHRVFKKYGTLQFSPFVLNIFEFWFLCI